MTVNIPVIYGSKLALEMIKKKLREFDIHKTPTFTTIDDATKIKTKYFLIEFYRVCHSIPDAFGVYIETKNARIIESGDFKFDFSTKGDEFDVIKLAGFGKRDIDLLMCESTNAETEGFAPSEKYVIDELKSIIEMCPGRVYVATFASNLQRIDEIIQIAVKNKRKICLLGRSMNTNVGISIDIGFLNVSKSQFIEARDVNKYPDQEVLILCTGSQGEELAALNQLANGKNV
jgi:ribonuclease J